MAADNDISLKIVVEGKSGDTPVEGRRIRILSADGREAFAIRLGKDGRSLDISGVDTFRAGEKFYGSRLLVSPGATNAITVHAAPYHDE